MKIDEYNKRVYYTKLEVLLRGLDSGTYDSFYSAFSNFLGSRGVFVSPFAHHYSVLVNGIIIFLLIFPVISFFAVFFGNNRTPDEALNSLVFSFFLSFVSSFFIWGYLGYRPSKIKSLGLSTWEGLNDYFICEEIVRSYFLKYQIGTIDELLNFYENEFIGTGVVIDDVSFKIIIVLRKFSEDKVLNSFPISKKIMYIWNDKVTEFSDSYIERVSNYFQIRQMGDLSDVVNFTGISSEFIVGFVISYLEQSGDLELFIPSSSVYKWTHDISFSEGVETVHLEID